MDLESKSVKYFAGRWPACCCVAAFVEVALQQLGYWPIDRASIAHKLGIRVGPDDDNPWGLPIELNAYLRGLPVREAEKSIPSVLREFSTDLDFKHIPFNKIILGLHIELFGQATKQNCIVGVGFNRARFINTSKVLCHVVRIAPSKNPEIVLMIDDSIGSPNPEQIRWSDLEPAVADIKDGFWIIGKKTSLSFDFNTSLL